MKLKVRKLAWILGGLSVLGATSLLAIACTSNGDDVAPPGPDSGRPTPTTTPTTSPDGAPTTLPDGATPPPPDAGSQPDCGSVPRLRPPSAPDAGPDASSSFYCPFGDGGTGGTDKRYCGGEQTCCSGQGASAGGFDTSYCTATKAEACAPPTGARAPRTRWECGAKENCGAAEKCCIPGNDGGPPAIDVEKVAGKTCPPEFQRGFFIGGTACRTACQSGELEACTRDADCVSPKKCVAFATNGRDLGACK